MDRIKADLHDGKNVVCDCLALNSISRRWILSELSGVSCRKILVVKVTPVEVCLQRNEGRARKVTEEQIRASARMLEPPAEGEGWDEIQVSRDEGDR